MGNERSKIQLLTCDSLSMTSTLSSGNEDYIPLASIGIPILEEEEVVDSIISQGRYLDDETDRTGEALLDDEVLLPSNLWFTSVE
jgi:hypothetical protein